VVRRQEEDISVVEQVGAVVTALAVWIQEEAAAVEEDSEESVVDQEGTQAAAAEVDSNPVVAAVAAVSEVALQGLQLVLPVCTSVAAACDEVVAAAVPDAHRRN